MMAHTPTLDMQAGQVDFRQDPNDPTEIVVEVVDTDGNAYTLTSDWDDDQALFTVDNTAKATGVITLNAVGKDAGRYPFLIRDADDFTWLEGYLIVGNLGRRGGSKSNGIRIVAGSGTVKVTVAQTVPTGTYAQARSHARAKSASATMLGIPGVVPTGLQTGSPGADLLNYEPFVVDQEITIDRIGIEIVSAAATDSVARLGIYEADADWQPTDLVVDAGEVAVDAVSFQSVSLSQTLSPGLYLAAYHSAAAPTLRIITGGPGGLVETLGSTAIVNRLRVSKTYAALADPGTAWDTRAGASNGFHHFVVMRW